MNIIMFIRSMNIFMFIEVNEYVHCENVSPQADHGGETQVVSDGGCTLPLITAHHCPRTATSLQGSLITAYQELVWYTCSACGVLVPSLLLGGEHGPQSFCGTAVK